MTDRPVIFAAPMVRALLDGTKTQTRRLASSPLARCQAGDRLWVRETFSGHCEYDEERWPPSAWFTSDPIWYWADGAPVAGTRGRRRPGIHMPRWASRLTLMVTEVRPQGLDDITNGDAEAEGFREGRLNDGFGPRDFGSGLTIESPGTFASAAGVFLIAWQALHPKWDGYENTPVVALTFTVERRNIDAGSAP